MFFVFIAADPHTIYNRFSLTIICLLYTSKKIGIPAVSGTIWETQIGYTYNMTADDVKVISYTIPLPVC